MTLRETLIKYKYDHNVTTAKLSVIVGKSPNTLNGYINGSRNPSKKTRERIISKLFPKEDARDMLLPRGIVGIFK